MKKVVIALLGVLGSFAVCAQSPVVSTSVNRTNILIGEQLELTLKTTFAPDLYKGGLFEIPAKIDHFTIVSTDRADTAGGDGYVTLTQKLVLTSFDTGRRVIPPFELQVLQAGNKPSFTMYSDSVPVQVSFSPPDSVQPFHDIKTIIEAQKAKDYKWLWIGLIVTVLLVLVLLLVRWLRKRHPKKDAETPAIAPLEEAMKALKNLKEENLPEKGEYKVYHSRLSDILKRFIARKSGKQVLNMTTEEVLLFLNGRTGRDNISLWANTLYLNDAVKFAKYKPAVVQSKECLAAVEKMITALDKTEKAQQIGS